MTRAGLQSVQNWSRRVLPLTMLCLASTFFAPLVTWAEGSAKTGLAALEEEYGFRGAHFGDALSDLKGLKLKAERGVCEKDYTRPGDKLEFGGVALSGVEYSLQNGRLTVVSLLATKEQCNKLYQALVKAYGDDSSSQKAAVASQPFWNANWTSERVRLEIVGPNDCTVTITAPEEAILEERQCREDDRTDASKGR